MIHIKNTKITTYEEIYIPARDEIYKQLLSLQDQLWYGIRTPIWDQTRILTYNLINDNIRIKIR